MSSALVRRPSQDRQPPRSVSSTSVVQQSTRAICGSRSRVPAWPTNWSLAAGSVPEFVPASCPSCAPHGHVVQHCTSRFVSTCSGMTVADCPNRTRRRCWIRRCWSPCCWSRAQASIFRWKMTKMSRCWMMTEVTMVMEMMRRRRMMMTVAMEDQGAKYLVVVAVFIPPSRCRFL